MTEPARTPPAEVPPVPPQQSGGVDVSGGRVEVGRDLAGRDIYEGFSAAAVQRLLITVGALVFLATMCSAVCFFVSGFAVASQVNAFSRPIDSTLNAARSMQLKLDLIAALPSGRSLPITFSETELSSYMRFVVGPPNGLGDARLRMLDTPLELAIVGNYQGIGGVPVLATFRMSTGDQPLELQSTAIQVFGSRDSAVGWIVVPDALVAPLIGRVVDPLFSQVRFIDIRESHGAERSWTITVLKK